MLDIDRETLEVYEFKDYKLARTSPFERLTINALYRDSPNKPPGYYIKLRLSELQTMWRNEWVALHRAHAKTLGLLWKRNAALLQTIPHADNLPFAVLYGSLLHEKRNHRMGVRRSKRLTQAKLTQILATLNRRKPSRVPIFDKTRDEKHHRVGPYRLYKLRRHMFERWKELKMKRQRERDRKI